MDRVMRRMEEVLARVDRLASPTSPAMSKTVVATPATTSAATTPSTTSTSLFQGAPSSSRPPIAAPGNPTWSTKPDCCQPTATPTTSSSSSEAPSPSLAAVSSGAQKVFDGMTHPKDMFKGGEDEMLRGFLSVRGQRIGKPLAKRLKSLKRKPHALVLMTAALGSPSTSPAAPATADAAQNTMETLQPCPFMWSQFRYTTCCTPDYSMDAMLLGLDSEVPGTQQLFKLLSAQNSLLPQSLHAYLLDKGPGLSILHFEQVCIPPKPPWSSLCLEYDSSKNNIATQVTLMPWTHLSVLIENVKLRPTPWPSFREYATGTSWQNPVSLLVVNPVADTQLFWCYQMNIQFKPPWVSVCSESGVTGHMCIQYSQKQAVSTVKYLRWRCIDAVHCQSIVQGNPNAIQCWKHWLTLLEGTKQVCTFNKKSTIELLQSSHVALIFELMPSNLVLKNMQCAVAWVISLLYLIMSDPRAERSWPQADCSSIELHDSAQWRCNKQRSRHSELVKVIELHCALACELLKGTEVFQLGACYWKGGLTFFSDSIFQLAWSECLQINGLEQRNGVDQFKLHEKIIVSPLYRQLKMSNGDHRVFDKGKVLQLTSWPLNQTDLVKDVALLSMYKIVWVSCCVTLARHIPENLHYVNEVEFIGMPTQFSAMTLLKLFAIVILQSGDTLHCSVSVHSLDGEGIAVEEDYMQGFLSVGNHLLNRFKVHFQSHAAVVQWFQSAPFTATTEAWRW